MIYPLSLGQSYSSANHQIAGVPGQETRRMPKNKSYKHIKNYAIDDLMQKRCNSIANVLGLHLFCDKPSISPKPCAYFKGCIVY